MTGDDARMFERWRVPLLLAAAALVSVSGGIHLRLYREQYRDVHVDRVLGIDLASSFVLAVATSAVVALLLVLSVAFDRAGRVVAVVGVLYAAGAVVAYALSRTVGLLGFEENRWIPEAALVKPVELVAAVLLGATLLARRHSALPAR